MAKALDAPYAAGRRGAAWLKVKQARTLDLVVLAAEWGNGRRQGWLSNLHLGARDPETAAFVMLGKTFKGLTDEMLAWQTEQLLALEIGRDAYTVHVRPELVVEIAFNEIQDSPLYPGGLALRFARVKRYRTDKTAADADTIDTVRALSPMKRTQRHAGGDRWDDMPKETVTPLLDRRLITGHRMMLAHVYLKKGCIVPLHSRTTTSSCTYVLEGALQFWIGDEHGETIVIGPGEVLVIPSNVAAQGGGARRHARRRRLQSAPPGLASTRRTTTCGRTSQKSGCHVSVRRIF